jgi:AraC family transcriptional regulator
MGKEGRSYIVEPRIETLTEKKLIGKRITMSFSGNRTLELWQGFMARRKEIHNTAGTDLYSIEVYSPSYWDNFSPDRGFEKWAAVEVTDFGSIPDAMEAITVPGGLYAVFVHKGPASAGPKTYGYIFGTWLPESDFLLDNRPHFALMGPKYKNDDPESEEEIWIPIKPRRSS